jgi:phytoene synthase
MPGERAAYFLPKQKRSGVEAVIAFARMIRDAVAGGDTNGSPVRAIGECCSADVAPLVRSRIEAMYDQRLELPLPQFRDETQRTLAAVADVVKRYQIPRQRWLDLLDGLVADAGVLRYPTWRSLEQHCGKTGGSIGVTVAGVLGVTSSDIGFVEKIGVAARLTSILVNLNDDLERDHLFLPLEDLARFRYGERELSGRVVNERLRELVRFEVDRARDLFREGSAGLRWLAGDGSRMAAATYVAMQMATLDAIQRAGFDVFAADLRLSAARQLRQLASAWRLARAAGAAARAGS